MSADHEPAEKLTSTHSPRKTRKLLEVGQAFFKLGLISFGGPVAHIGYLREEFVSKRRWLDDAAFSDVVALCQFLPGPASSQVVFALGMQRAGWLGGLLASLCFTLPSAVLMIAFGYGVATVGNLNGAGWLHGLKLAAVAVVALAVWSMGRNLCPDRPRLIMAVAAAALLLIFPGALVQVGVIVGGGLLGWWLYRRSISGSAVASPADWRNHLAAAGILGIFFMLLILLPVLAANSGRPEIAVFDSFYRASSLVFGGGHVVLPLLRAEVVPPGWVTDDAFLAGYGAAQAVPGPLFTFAAYLGTAMNPGVNAWLNGLWCLLGIFLPAWLLIAGALPFWQQLRGKVWSQAALRGANAAVVGILLAALYDPVWKEGVRGLADVVVVILLFASLHWGKLPPWLMVIVAAVVGQWVLPRVM